MTIATVDDIAAALAVSFKIRSLKNISVPKAIGSMQSSWLAVGLPPAGATPPAYTAGSGYTSDKSTLGALPYINAVVKNYLAKLFAVSAIAGTLRVYDRLWSCSGMGFALGTYTVTTPGNLPARITDNGLGCELFVEQSIAAGAASGTLTANYLDSAGASKAGVIPAVVSAPLIGQVQQVPMANNLGIKQLTSVVTSATWTSGSFGMLIAKHVASIEVPLAGIGKTLDWAGLALPDLVDDMCLMFIWHGGAATAAQVQATAEIIDK
jgi:hypothetical protein